MGAEAPVSTRFALSLDSNGQSIAPYMIAFSASLLTTLQAKALAATTAPEVSIPRFPEQQFETRNGIELLLDVELPVGVSFGKAILPLKDVIKLTSGSIVELNRSINEPVEVIVNNCVIAKGEVVVVDGNYGVRIHHIVSRQERLRSIH